MGYDFLGTMGLTQWNKLKDFSVYHVTEHAGEDTKYVRHLVAEIIRAERLLKDLETASGNFNNFVGDVAYNPNLSKPVSGLVFNLSDSDTAVLVNDMKMLMKPILKRKKDNIEYRVKKARDLIEQLSQKAYLWIQGQEVIADLVSTVNIHFTDDAHKHNLSKGEMMDAQGHIKHNVVSLVAEDPEQNLQTGSA